MQKKSEQNGNFSTEQAMRLAGSHAGKQLFAFLQQTQGDKLQYAMDQAAAGDMAQVKKAMQDLMRDQKAQELLKKMQEQANG